MATCCSNIINGTARFFGDCGEMFDDFVSDITYLGNHESGPKSILYNIASYFADTRPISLADARGVQKIVALATTVLFFGTINLWQMPKTVTFIAACITAAPIYSSIKSGDRATSLVCIVAFNVLFFSPLRPLVAQFAYYAAMTVSAIGALSALGMQRAWHKVHTRVDVSQVVTGVQQAAATVVPNATEQ